MAGGIVLRSKFHHSLSVKVFLITFLVQIVFGALIIGGLYLATPQSYSMAKEKELKRSFEELVSDLCKGTRDEGGPKIDKFVRDTGAYVVLYRGGQEEEEGLVIVPLNAEYSIHSGSQIQEITAKNKDAYMIGGAHDVTFTDAGRTYTLEYVYYVGRTNPMSTAIVRCLPILILLLLAVSLGCAYIYTLLFARPVKKLSRVSRAMAQMDFSQKCASTRKDEIGDLARDLDTMAGSLDEKIHSLNQRTSELEEEVHLRRELESQKDMFFSAASHELKTPVTVLEGQIRGMIDGVEPYSDHDVYLPKALGTVKRMESLINEILTASRMQSGQEIAMTRSDMAQILEEKQEEYEDLLEVRGIKMELEIEPDLFFTGNQELTALAVGAFLSNAVFYSKEDSKVLVDGEHDETNTHVRVIIRNTNAHIEEEDLIHLFEPFYRSDKSRSRRSGGSGLGLYLAKLILEKQGGTCKIENKENDVVAVMKVPV